MPQLNVNNQGVYTEEGGGPGAELVHVSTVIIPEVRADCSKNVSMTGKGFPVIHFHYNVCQLSLIVHCFELLKNTARMEGVHGIAGSV